MKTKHDYDCNALMRLLSVHSDTETNKKEFRRYSDVERRMGMGTLEIRKIAKETASSLDVALCLWNQNTYESRVLGILICPPDEATPKLVEKWLRETRSWAICDLIANDLISQNNTLFPNIKTWSIQEELYLKRGALSAIACRAQDLTELPEKSFDKFAKILWSASDDGRKYIKTACSWAIKELGKIDIPNKARAIALSEKMTRDPNKNRNWIGKDALKELKTLIKVTERPRLISSNSSVGKKYMEQQ